MAVNSPTEYCVPSSGSLGDATPPPANTMIWCAPMRKF
jgi:hypothetical protein